MKVDLYTKVVLTGILICLSLLLLRDAPIVDKAYADLTGRIPSTINLHLLVGEPDGGGLGGMKNFDIDD